MLGGKIAASGARQRSSGYIEVNVAAHSWRAVVLPERVEVPELAGKCDVVADPRPCALGFKVKDAHVVGAELAGGGGSKSPAGLAARNKYARGTRAAASRGLTETCKLGARSRAVGGRSHL